MTRNKTDRMQDYKYEDEMTHQVIRINNAVAENFDNWYKHIQSKYGMNMSHAEVMTVAAQLTHASYLQQIQYHGLDVITSTNQ